MATAQDFLNSISGGAKKAALSLLPGILGVAGNNDPEAMGKYVGQFAQNAGQDALGIGKGITQIPGQIIQGVSHPDQGAKMLENTVGNMARGVNDLVGDPYNEQTQQFQAPSIEKVAANAYNHPVNSVLNAEMLVGGINKLASGKNAVKAAGEDAATATKPGMKVGDVQLPSEADPSFGQRIEQAGKNITDRTRQIRVKGAINGAAKEDAINATLDKYGFKGMASDQYRRLQPVMSAIEDTVQNKLASDTTTVPVSTISDAITGEVKKSMTPSAFESTKVQKVVDNLIQDAYSTATNTHGVPVPKDMPLSDLFSLKRSFGDSTRMEAIRNKLAAGKDLTPEEMATTKAYRAINDIIAEKRPDIRELTQDQSNLFDAAPSLSAARNNAPVYRAFGTSIPAEASQLVNNVAGPTLEKAGRAIQGSSGLVKNANGFLPPIAPILANNSASQGLENSPQNLQDNNGQEPSNNQLNTNQDNSHATSIPQAGVPLKPEEQKAAINQPLPSSMDQTIISNPQQKFLEETQNLHPKLNPLDAEAYQKAADRRDQAQKALDSYIANNKLSAPEQEVMKDAGLMKNKMIAMNKMIEAIPPSVLNNITQLSDLQKISQPSYQAAKTATAIFNGYVDKLAKAGAIYDSDKKELTLSMGDQPEQFTAKMGAIANNLNNFYGEKYTAYTLTANPLAGIQSNKFDTQAPTAVQQTQSPQNYLPPIQHQKGQMQIPGWTQGTAPPIQ